MNRNRYAELSALIAQRQPACGTTTVVALDGPSGSGKTSLATRTGRGRLAAAFCTSTTSIPAGTGSRRRRPSYALACSIASPPTRSATSLAGTGTAIDLGRPCAYRPTPLLILDGVGSGASTIRPFLSLLLWVDAPLGVRKRRALARDGGAYEPFWDIWAEQEARHFAAEQTRIHADRIIDTGD